MRVEYDSEANALSIDLVDEQELHAGYGEELGAQCVVAIDAAGRPVKVEVLDPARWLEEALSAASERYGLDREALEAAARSALAAPDRVVVIEVGARAAA